MPQQDARQPHFTGEEIEAQEVQQPTPVTHLSEIRVCVIAHPWKIAWHQEGAQWRLTEWIEPSADTKCQQSKQNYDYH